MRLSGESRFDYQHPRLCIVAVRLVFEYRGVLSYVPYYEKQILYGLAQTITQIYSKTPQQHNIKNASMAHLTQKKSRDKRS